jgi:hypothetical protein
MYGDAGDDNASETCVCNLPWARLLRSPHRNSTITDQMVIRCDHKTQNCVVLGRWHGLLRDHAPRSRAVGCCRKWLNDAAPTGGGLCGTRRAGPGIAAGIRSCSGASMSGRLLVARGHAADACGVKEHPLAGWFGAACCERRDHLATLACQGSQAARLNSQHAERTRIAMD